MSVSGGTRYLDWKWLGLGPSHGMRGQSAGSSWKEKMVGRGKTEVRNFPHDLRERMLVRRQKAIQEEA
jgi:hypothetical protein